MCSHHQLYVVILLFMVTPPFWAKPNNTSNDKQNILKYYPLGLGHLNGNWSSEKGIRTSDTKNETNELTYLNKQSSVSQNFTLGFKNITFGPTPHKPNSTFGTHHQPNEEAEISEEFPYRSLYKWRYEKYRPTLMFKNSTLKTETTLISRSRNIVNFSKKYHDSIDLSFNQKEHEYTIEQPYLNSPSPCLNGGTFITNNGNYICRCAPLYSGINCEIHTGICQQPVGFDKRLPCIWLGKSCRPVPGGGFVCESDVIVTRNTSYHNMSNLVQCLEESMCPEGWECFNINLKGDNYRCEPPHNELFFPDFHGIDHNRRTRRSTEEMCRQNLCQNGAICRKNKCICLLNYSGRYCEKEVNYCLSKPCKQGVTCEQRLGGYMCDCPATHIGLNCEISKRISSKQMKNPHFVYVIQQYVAMMFEYCFYANSMGDLPGMKIDFGDGAYRSAQENKFTHVDDATNEHLKRVFPSLNFLNTNAQIVVFKHSYKNLGLYNVSVEATNVNHVVYKSMHVVRVDLPTYCKMSTKLRNCVKSVGANITEYTREDQIVILSDTITNCTHAILNFAWTLHKLSSKFDKGSEANEFHFEEDEVATKQPHLNIYPYTLPFGIYAAQLNVTMRKPKSSLVGSALTWFLVKELKVIAKFVEGSMQQVRWSGPIVLNASMSYNPNMPPNKQDNLAFTWTCEVDRNFIEENSNSVDTFCPSSQDIPLTATGPILNIPPRSLLLNWAYNFVVYVKVSSSSSGLNVYNLTEATATLLIVVKPDDTPILTVTCIRNCNNNQINPDDATVFEAVCSTCYNGISQELGSLEWHLTNVGNGHNANTSPMDNNYLEAHSKTGKLSSTLILDEGTLVGFEKYIVSLRAAKVTQNATLVNGTIVEASGDAERLMRIASPPETGYCNILPQQGYAMLTSFHIFCYNFKDQNPPLQYEATQFTNYSKGETNFPGTLVGYDIESEIHDIRLTAGLPDYDYVTLIRTIVSSKYLYTYYDFNVTVFPVLYYLKSPVHVLNLLSHMARDEMSYLGLMQGTSNFFANIQMVKVTAESVANLLQSDYVRYIDVIELADTVESIQDGLANYLSQQPILNLAGLKHFATALDAILKLPRYHIISPSNKIGGELLEKIVDTLTDLKNKNVRINKVDVEDLAPRIMSVALNLLRMPQELQSKKATQRTFGFLRSDVDNNDKTPVEEVNVESKETLANFTETVMKNIFSYGRHIISYKANHEKSTLCQSQLRGVKFSVQKNSPDNFVKNGLFIRGCVGLMPIFSEGENAFDHGLSVFMLYLEENPFWWHSKAKEITYPLVQLRMLDANSNAVKVPTKVMMHTSEKLEHKTIHGRLEIHPYWTLNDFDIQVNRIQVPKGGKVIVEFMPIKGNHKIQVIVKKGFRPELIDFWKEATVVPQKMTKNGTDIGTTYSIYIDDESTSDEEFYYIGVLPHVDTLHALLGRNIEDSFFPRMSNEEDNTAYDEDDDDKDEKEIEAQLFEPKAMKVREPTNNTLPFEYAAYSVRCLALNATAVEWNTNCQVRPATTYDTVFCKCDDFDMVSASFENVQGNLHMIRSVHFYFPITDHPLTFYLVFFILVLFLLLLLWALWLDREPYREIIFLADNDPQHMYFYLVIVQTGRRPRAGTTSNVAIQLNGESGNSQVHILKSGYRPVLHRASQEWFVLKTQEALGNISWINLWHDHLEASPHWYCSKVIIHDIQTNEVWFFVAEQWLAPLYGDGTISCSVYNTESVQVFEKRYRFGESLLKGFGDGFHGWFSLFYKTPQDNYTCCQRVVMAFVHILIMLMIVIHLFDWPTQDEDPSPDTRVWPTQLLNGIYTALIAFPVHLCLATAFMCVAPRPPWLYSAVYWRQFATIDMPDKKIQTKDDKEKAQYAQGDQYYTVAYTVGMKKSLMPPGKHKNFLPMVARRTGHETFCLPHWFKYVLWFIVVLFIIICLFFTYLNGVEQTEATGYCVLMALVVALLFSILFLEMGKVIIYAIYHSIVSRKEIIIEDRSDLVLHLEDEYKVAPPLIPPRLEELKQLREKDMYRPISEQRVNVLQRNAIKEASVRSMMADIGIFLLFLFLLIIAIYGITDSLGYYNVQNVKNLIQGHAGFGNIRLDKVDEREGFLNYINGSLIPNLYLEKDYNNNPLKEKGLTADYTNYLIGVPRLRQIRNQENSCKEISKSGRNWANRCSSDYFWVDGDTADYGPSWKKMEQSKPVSRQARRRGRDTGGDLAAWSHQSWWSLATVPSSGVVTTYGGGGYVALLGRTQEESWKSLEYLRKNKWFDRLTVAVFLEFTLYNPNRNLISTVTILAENTIMGDFAVHSSVQLVKAKSMNDILPFVIFALLATLVVTLIFCIHRDGFRIKKLRRWTYFGSIWHALNIVMAIMGIVVAFCLLQRTFLLNNSLKKLQEPDVNKYIQFNVLLYWDHFLLAILALMLFLVILQIWHLLSVEYNCNLVMTVLQVATHSVLCYAFIMAIFVCAFMMAGHLLFVTISYQFRGIFASFIATIGFSHRTFDLDSITGSSHNSSFDKMNWGKCFFMVFFLMYFFIFRWGFVLILIEKFRRVTLVALQRKWLEPVIASFMQMNLASVRDFGRRGYSRSQADSLIDEYIKASFRASLARLKAMELIAANLKEQQKLGIKHDSKFLIRSKEMAMAAIVIDHIEGQMRYKTRKPQASEDEQMGSTIRSTFTKEKKATAVIVTYLKMNELEQKLDMLNKTVDQLIQYELL